MQTGHLGASPRCPWPRRANRNAGNARLSPEIWRRASDSTRKTEWDTTFIRWGHRTFHGERATPASCGSGKRAAASGRLARILNLGGLISGQGRSTVHGMMEPCMGERPDRAAGVGVECGADTTVPAAPAAAPKNALSTLYLIFQFSAAQTPPKVQCELFLIASNSKRIA